MDFKITEYPSWRKRTTCTAPSPVVTSGTSPVPSHPSIPDMIKDINSYMNTWKENKDGIKEDILSETLKEMTNEYVYYINIHEDVGVGSMKEIKELNEMLNSSRRRSCKRLKRQISNNERETANILSAWEQLTKIHEVCCMEDKDNLGIVDLDAELKKLHKTLMCDITQGMDSTAPGVFSEKRRQVLWAGKVYEYPHLTRREMQDRLYSLEYRINSTTERLKEPGKNLTPCEYLEELFKCIAIFLYEFLDLHPFSDGNGRMGRLLSSYMLLKMCPFSSPIFNIYSETNKDDYIDALVHCRERDKGKPCDLAAMIVECNWFSWREFLKRLDINY
jgi:fido (protein-threonine AMPylation protein)